MWQKALSFTFWIHAMTAFEVDGLGSLQIEGVEYPAVGFGTYPLKDKTCFNAVLEAGELGYRLIDTATFYGNFIPVGQALKTMGRENFYVISKVWPTDQTPERLNKDIQNTLEELQTDYLDAYFLHWPNSKIPLESTLRAMEALRIQGIIRHIGLSNVTVNHLKKALRLNIPISWVQVEMHPQFFDEELLKFCHENRIGVQAWGPLGRGRLSEEPTLKKLGEKYGKTAAQISLKWIVQHKCIPLPGSKNTLHMQQNLDINDFTLSQEDMEALDQRARLGARERVTEASAVGFIDEFDFSYEECWPK